MSLSQITYAFQDGDRRRIILDEVSHDFEAGACYAVLGSSGSGKTTLLALMAALDAPASGTITYCGQDLKDIGYENFRRNCMGIVFQSYNLVPFLTAAENVLLAISNTDNQVPADKKGVVLNLLAYLGIDAAKAKSRVAALSGGEQQRVAIARALATNASLILADEPTGNLDYESSGEIARILVGLAHDHNKCVIVVTHSAEIAQQADIRLLLSQGRLEKMPENE